MAHELTFIEPNRDAFKDLISRGVSGPVTMLNLLRFREVADYSAFPDLAPNEPISGREAYRRYVDHAGPFVEGAGSEVLFRGEAEVTLIGPTEERWHEVLLVRHKSLHDFVAFANHTEYLAGLGHRTAALADSRLIPLLEG